MPKKTIPKYSHHKPTGQARVRINGKDIYLGVHGTPESYERYSEELANWQADSVTETTGLTVAQLTLIYKRWAKKHYVKNGKVTSEVSALSIALRHLNKTVKQYEKELARKKNLKSVPKTLAEEFSPKMLKRVQQSMVKAGYVRTSINRHVGRIKRMYKWAVSEELVPVTTFTALGTVSGLQRGRSDAVESQRVKPVPEAWINSVEDHVSDQVWGMIQLQLWTGMRPGEVRIMRGCDLNMTGKIWEYVPSTHKTEHHDKPRVVMIGKRGQEILKPFLKTDLQAYIFSPKDTKAKRAGDIYTITSYRRAIANACEDAEIPLWSPNRLRHNFATLARKEFGIEAARVTLGHSSAVTSEIYAEMDQEKARAVVAKIG